MIRRLPKRSPTFVLLDTEGIDPAWSTLEAIAPWQTELLITFPLGMAINRNLDSLKVTRYFGSEDWRGLWNASRPGEVRSILDFYKGRLKDLGYAHPSGLDERVCTTDGKDLYYLVHVSKVEAAANIMKWVKKQPTSRG